MSGLWSREQQGWLAALGHTLYVHGGLEPLAPEEAIAPVAAEPMAEPMRVAEAMPARKPPTPRVPPRHADTDIAPSRAGVAPRAASRMPDKLHFALIRASGCNPNAEDAASIFSQWPPSSELRGNPAAKRALWPKLRALRRRPSP